jgi:hypothetical protein
MRLIERPGYIGRKKEEKHAQWNKKYGEGNWKFIWRWGEILIGFEQACRIYEDAYYHDSFKREPLWKDLFSKAKDFFDNAESNVNSGLDYKIQEAYSTHIQDIAIRNVAWRRGWKMKGNRLIKVRGPESKGHELMPGKVRFHLPELIERPNLLPSWAEPNSTEAFYQNNRWLVIK